VDKLGRLLYTGLSDNWVGGDTAYCETFTKHINTARRDKSEILNFQISGTDRNHKTLRRQKYDMIYLLTVIGFWHPVAVVQYTFTRKQYTEPHNETQYLERNIHNNNNHTQFTKLNRSI